MPELCPSPGSQAAKQSVTGQTVQAPVNGVGWGSDIGGLIFLALLLEGSHETEDGGSRLVGLGSECFLSVEL